MSNGEAPIASALGDYVVVILSTIMPKGRHAAQGLIFLLVIAIALGAFFGGHTLRFKWWDVPAARCA